MAQPTPIELDGIACIPTSEGRDKALAEIHQRPQVLPLNQRHYFTAQELQDIRDRTPEAIAKWPALCGNQNYGR